MDRLAGQRGRVRTADQADRADTDADVVWSAAYVFVGNACPDADEMKNLFALLVMLFTATSAFAQATPTATPTAAFDFPNAPTLEQSVTGPAGQTLTWDGRKWVAVGGITGNFAPLVNPQNGQNNYAPLNSPAFSGTTTATALQVANTLTAPTATLGTATLGNTTITTGSVLMLAGTAALYFNGIPMGGTCAAGSAVTLINNRGVPTCSPFAAAGGPWLPVNNPTFTGTLSGPIQVNTGDLDSLTWNDGTSGLAATFGDGYGNTSESSFLIGQSMSYTGGVPNSWTLGGSAAYGPTAATSLQFFGAATVITGDTGLTSGQTFLPTMLFSISPVAYPLNQFMGNVAIPVGAAFNVPVTIPTNSLGIGQAAGVYGYSLEITRNQNADTGINILNNNAGASASTSIYVWNGGPSLKLQQAGPNTTLGGSAVGASVVSSDGPELDLIRASGTSGGLNVRNQTGPIDIWVNNTLTEHFVGWTLNFPNTTVGSQIQFGTYNAPDASILGWGPQNLHINSGAWWSGGQWTASASNAPIDINMLTNGNYYPNMTIGMSGYVGAGTAISSWPGMAMFENHPYVQGLDLPGYANRAGNGQPVAGLTVGNGYLSGINWANVSISGASYPIANGSGWQTDCGAGSGMTLFQVGPGGGLHMYNHAGLGCNAGFAWNNIANWSVAGMTVNHIENLDTEPAATLNGAPTESPVPSVTSGALVKGSRDMFGWIKDVKGGQTTLTFTQDFDGESTCTLTDAGQPNLWFEANQTTAQDTFVCVVPWTGEPCPDGAIVEYHCFGQGG